MKVGDLVKHPEGEEKVCPTTYSLGVVLEIIKGNFYGAGIKVNWLKGSCGCFVYPMDELEVIHEGR